MHWEKSAPSIDYFELFLGCQDGWMMMNWTAKDHYCC